MSRVKPETRARVPSRTLYVVWTTEGVESAHRSRAHAELTRLKLLAIGCAARIIRYRRGSIRGTRNAWVLPPKAGNSP